MKLKYFLLQMIIQAFVEKKILNLEFCRKKVLNLEFSNPRPIGLGISRCKSRYK